MICTCSMAGTPGCKNCYNYKNHFTSYGHYYFDIRKCLDSEDEKLLVQYKDDILFDACPKCGTKWTNPKAKYCCECGQKIKR